MIPRGAFAVLCLRELLWQCIENACSSEAIESLLGRKSRQFPVFFPVRREPRAETGSLETAPSAGESISVVRLARAGERPPRAGLRLVYRGVRYTRPHDHGGK